MTDPDRRSDVLTWLGATPHEKEELLAYNKNVFDHEQLRAYLEMPFLDEAFVSAWEDYASEAKDIGVFNALKKRLVQLCFPIQEGISQAEFYREVTRKGVSPADIAQATGLILKHPEGLQLVLHQTPAGRVPLIITSEREDFVSLIQALAKRNEPSPVPDPMGAVIIAGYNNWDRIRTYRKKWEAENPSDCSQQKWKKEFKRIIPQKELYQDRFIILSNGPYSAVSAREMGFSEDKWKRLSVIIRREHECTHYFTRRLFTSMQNRLIDELMADYMGIVAATGRYRADWFLRFIGLENFPEYREGGRLENYRGDPPLSDGSFKILQVLAKNAAENLERFDQQYQEERQTLQERAIILIALTCLALEELASKEAVSLLQQSISRVKRDVMMDTPP